MLSTSEVGPILALIAPSPLVRVSGITFIRYAQNRKVGKPNNLKVLRASKPKGLNRIAKIASGHLYPREENLNFNNTFII